MPIAPKSETPEQRELRLVRQRRYEAKRRSENPEAFKKAQAENSARHRRKFPEKVKQATKKWRAENRERFNDGRRRWRSENLIRALLNEARSRAKARNVAFEITINDIPPMGERCPLLGHPFPPSDVRRTPFSPSLDRIDPSKGYVPGNVWVVGYRANLIKNDGTAEEHAQIARAMRRMLGQEEL